MLSDNRKEQAIRKASLWGSLPSFSQKREPAVAMNQQTWGENELPVAELSRSSASKEFTFICRGCPDYS